MKNLRELEDLVIEAIYGGDTSSWKSYLKPLIYLFVTLDVIHGKLDQRNGRLEVDFAIGRDAQVNDIGTIIQTLSDWCDACDAILGAVETQVINANVEKERHIKHRTSIEEEIINIKKALKSQVLDNF